MCYIFEGGKNYGDDPRLALQYMHERDVYFALMLNFGYPNVEDRVSRSIHASCIDDQLDEFGSVDLHPLNINIAKQILEAYPECEGMLRKFKHLDLNPYVKKKKKQIKQGY